ncbi:aldehyde dehydrogenase (NAD+) [Cladophialophora psammophila CBS 110553]|uniref:aldehyde dehydrogenase (NAD(+)) n=1 Tax=Cladophialophora psammophila CBS 110553 TaxID=1182543 RepID=W9X3V2_9EURO|nr:aldehyde dehydrogenase (NAD+) [Cladophialophora psammophila CBS 110553]EXJ71975.1 aldehyde dehydrogenase (NAD+) [Cladophialophora psammophila CBS 110553]
MGSISGPGFDVFNGFYNTINGKLTGTEQTRHGINPATGKPNPEVPVSTPKDVDDAVAAAKEAFKSWSQTPYEKRRECVLAFADALEKYATDFGRLLTQEQGKPVQFGVGEAHTGVQWMRALAKLELKEEVVEENDEKQVIVRYTPLGVCVGIVPWNFPVHLACGKIAPSVLTGNPIIIKPSPFTPYCDLKLGELAQQFFPPGVIQVLSGDDNLGPWLTAHPGPDKISFTGSTVTGKKVMESAAKTLKRVTLELGGKDPAIICKNVDINAVAAKIATLAFLNSGQICLAIKRIYVHESIHDKFRDAMVEFTKTLKVGDGTEEGVFLGPIQNKMQYEKVKTFFNDIEKEKWTVAVGGKNEDKPGYFITPTIIDKPADDSRIATEEPFGPIVPLMTWTDEADVVARANNTKMGLGASVWSDDLDEAARIARQLDAGSVWVNTHLEVDPNAPFGGHKESGIGFEWGIGGLKSFCNVQSLFLKKKTSA